MHHAVSALLTGVCCVLIVLSLTAVWLHQTVVSTSGFVSTMTPIIQRPAVASAISSELTTQLSTAIDLEGEIAKRFPVGGRILAQRLTVEAESFIEGQVASVLRSSPARSLWVAVLEATHGQVVAALRGQSSVVRVANGAIVLDLLPLFNQGLQEAESRLSAVIGHDIAIPSITNGELSAEIRSQLSSAFGVQLPADFGQIEIARAGTIQSTETFVRVLDELRWLLPIVALLLISVTLWQSINVRRTVLQILAGTAVLLIVERETDAWVGSRVVAVVNPNGHQVAGFVVDELLHSLDTVLLWAIVAAVIAFVLVLLTGPYTWAAAFRRHVVRLPGDLIGAAGRR